MPKDIAYRSLAEQSPVAVGSSEVPEPYYPTVHLDAKQFPELFKFGVSDKLEMCFMCKIKSKSESEESKSMSLEFRAGAIYNSEKDGYSESPAVAVVVTGNEADAMLKKLTEASPRRM